MTKWTKHTGTGKPSELADAQLILVTTPDPEFGVSVRQRADKANWWATILWKPALDPYGLPYVSAEGLEPGTEYVATEYDGSVISFGAKPRYMESVGEWDFLPGDVPHLTVNEMYTGDPGPEYAIPGDPEHSLARVWRE